MKPLMFSLLLLLAACGGRLDLPNEGPPPPALEQPDAAADSSQDALSDAGRPDTQPDAESAPPCDVVCQLTGSKVADCDGGDWNWTVLDGGTVACTATVCCPAGSTCTTIGGWVGSCRTSSW